MTERRALAEAGPVPFVRLSGYYFFYYAFIGVFMPYFALFLKGRGFSSAEIGGLLAIQQWMRLLAPNLWGWLADRAGRRMPVLRAAALCSLGGFSIILLDASFTGIALSLALMGFFWTAQGPLAEATSFGHLAGRHGYGAIRAWGSFGFIVAVLGMGWWLERAEISRVIDASIMILVAIAACAMRVPEAPGLKRERARGGLGEILRRPQVLALLASCTLMTAAHGAFNVFYSIHLVAAGYSKSTIGLLWTLGVLAEILVFLWAPRLMARFSLRSLLIFALAVAVLRFALIGWGAGHVALLLAMQLLHGVTFGLNHIAAISAISRWFGGAHQAQGQALYGSASAGAGGIIGSLASGCLWDAVGAGWTYTAGSGFALAGLGLLVCLWRREDEA